MIDRSGQIGHVLALLHHHSELVVEAIDSAVLLGNKARDKSIDALASIHALIPDGDGNFWLNPRIRDYLDDHLLNYNAFQTLTRLDEPIVSMMGIWSGLKELRSSGQVVDSDRLERALDDVVTTIGYEIERNMTLLNFMVTTEYGNVSSLIASVQQVRFYKNEVRSATSEMIKLDAVIDQILEEAGQIPAFAVVRFIVMTRLRSRMSPWITRLNDLQAVISARLGRMAKLQTQMANLGKAALWMSQNVTSPGFRFPNDVVISDALLRPERIPVNWHLDVRDRDPVVLDPMIVMLNRLPAPAAPALVVRPSGPRILTPRPVVMVEEVDPVDQVLETLSAGLAARADAVVSLLAWKRCQPDLDDVTEEEWLFYASAHLVFYGHTPWFQFVPRAPGMVNDLFTDVVVGVGEPLDDAATADFAQFALKVEAEKYAELAS